MGKSFRDRHWYDDYEDNSDHKKKDMIRKARKQKQEDREQNFDRVEQDDEE